MGEVGGRVSNKKNSQNYRIKVVPSPPVKNVNVLYQRHSLFSEMDCDFFPQSSHF